MHGLGLKTKKHGCATPQPAWTEPTTPAPCPTPKNGVCNKGNEPCVPSAACNGSCKDGPPAVLLGDECNAKNLLHLPTKGKRGCILLSPTKVVAPVGGEVVLLSGICGTDGYLQMNEQLEWMLTPESVGTFIQVGDDDPGIIGRLVGSKVRPEKYDPSHARGITSTKRTLITRGNMDPQDDVQLEKGQTWITLSSPSEGTSRVTVLAPESECWDQRKATTTIYWVDARWQFPGPQIVPAGTPVELTTRVTRTEGGLPARGWRVRYEILQPELATFAEGATVVEANVDDSGNASVQIAPRPGTSGTAAVDMQVIRPGGELDNIPTISLGRGQTFITWSAPKLAIRAGGPTVASFNTPFQVVANVSNPGDQPVTNVRVDVPIPQGVKVVSSDNFARVLPNMVTWEIGSIPPQQQLDLFLNISAQSPLELAFQARGDGLVAEDRVRVDIFQPSLSVQVSPVQQRVETGQRVTFNIDVTNTGTRPLQNVYLTATGDDGMVHEGGQKSVRNPKEDGLLQPGQTWGAQVVFVPTTSGQRCITVDAFADGGQRETHPGCVTVINPVPKTPSLTATLEGRNRIATKQTCLVRAKVVNTGLGPATNVKVIMAYTPEVQLTQATEGSDQTQIAQNIVSWTVPVLEAEQAAVFEGQFTANRAAPRARITLQVECAEGPKANTDFIYEIIDMTPPPVSNSAPATVLPPALAPPIAPSGSAPTLPLQGSPNTTPPPTAPPITTPQRTEQLQLQLFALDNPARITAPIRYRMIVTNDSSQRDGQVEMQFQLPPGVSVQRASPVTNPEQNDFRINGSTVSLEPIRSIEPGASEEYQIVLISNQPQTFNFTIQARSQRMPAGISRTLQTTVTP